MYRRRKRRTGRQWRCAQPRPRQLVTAPSSPPPPSPQVAAEALRVCEQLVREIRPDVGAPLAPGMLPLVKPLYDCVMARLEAQVRGAGSSGCLLLPWACCVMLGVSAVLARPGRRLPPNA